MGNRQHIFKHTLRSSGEVGVILTPLWTMPKLFEITLMDEDGNVRSLSPSDMKDTSLLDAINREKKEVYKG